MEYKSFMEALKGKQHKIDKNKNGQIDAHDFKLLRKEETEELEEGYDKSSEHHKNARKMAKDYDGKATFHPNGHAEVRMRSIVHGHSTINPQGTTLMSGEDLANRASKEHGKGKVQGNVVHFKEETEELEEATVKTQKYSWGTMKTVHHGSDFSIPLHPEHHQEIAKLKDQQEHKFKTEDGKHWTAKRSGDDVHFQGANGGNSTTVKHSTMSEEVQIDEIRRMKTKLNTLDDISNKSVARQKLSNLMKSGKARGALIANKMRTLNMGDDLDQEDLDALYEVLSKDAKAGDYISDFVHSTNPKFDGKSKKERINMALGAYYSTHKKKDGVSEGYYEKPASAYRRKGDEVRDPTPVAPVPDRKYIKGTPENKALKASRKPINGHPTNEEVEQIEEKSEQAKQNKTMKNMMDASRGARHKLNNPVPAAEPEHKTARAHNVAIGRALRSEDKMTTTKDKSGKLVSFKYEGDWKKTTKADAKKDPAGKVANMAGQAMQKMKNMSEEKDEQEYGYEGDMALNQLATLTRCAEMIKEILKPDTDMPEWVQSKITLATDYIQTAADYMHSEMNEAKSVEVKVNAAGDAPHEEKWEAVKKIKKPVKESFDDEGNLISNKVSYKEFMLEYTPGPGGVTQIKGRSYGANYSDPEGADDADDNKPMKPAAEKRGRGRPAGAKSGARKITGTSKLMNK